MVLRWTAAGILDAERSFRRIKGYKQMPQLIAACTDTTPPTRETVGPPHTVHPGRGQACWLLDTGVHPGVP